MPWRHLESGGKGITDDIGDCSHLIFCIIQYLDRDIRCVFQTYTSISRPVPETPETFIFSDECHASGFSAIQNEVHVVAHQAETIYFNCCHKQTNRDIIHSGYIIGIVPEHDMLPNARICRFIIHLPHISGSSEQLSAHIISACARLQTALHF